MVKDEKYKRWIIYAAVALVLILGSLLSWHLIRADNTKSVVEPSQNQVTEPQNSEPNPTTPTEDDNNSSANSKKTVAVIITSWGDYSNKYEVSAYAKTLENKGVCSLTIKRGSESFSTTRQATPNVSNMSCGTMTIDSSKLSPGTWTIAVSYESSNSRGSKSQSVEVQ